MTSVSATNRAHNVRVRAKRIGLTMAKRGDVVTLFDDSGLPAFVGSLDHAEVWVADRFAPRKPGPNSSVVPTPWRPWLELFVQEQRAAKRSPETIHTRVLCLSTFARANPDSDPRTVTRDDLARYLAANDDWSPSTAHNVRSTFRVFFRMLCDLGHRRGNPAHTLPSIKIPRAMPRPCPDQAVRQAYATVTDPRVLLAIRIATESGMRRAEIARLRPSQVGGRPGAHWLHVTGKGGHQRAVPISDELAAAILDVTTEYVFPVHDGGPMTARHLGKLIARALPGEWTAHSLRHRFASRAYEVERDLRAVQELLGHTSPVTTAIYTKVSDQSMRRAAMSAAIDPESSLISPG